MDRTQRDDSRDVPGSSEGGGFSGDASGGHGNGSGSSEAQVLARIRAKRGYLLPFHELLARHLPGVLERYDDYYSQVWLQQNVLDARTKELVAIGIHAAVLEREGLEIHLRRAVAAGATDAEIVEAMTLAGIPAGMYAVVVAADVWQRVRESTGYSWERPAGGE